MSSTTTLLSRAVQEHKRLAIGLAALLVVNILVYAFYVYPMASRVANIEESSRIAASDLAAAKREFAQANGTLTGKDKASQELTTFYSTVLPRGVAGARRLTYLRLFQLARESNLTGVRQSTEELIPTGSTLKQLRLQMAFEGSYTNMRAFLHRLEVAPEFVVIDNVSLTEGADEGANLAINMEMSTYYRDVAP